MANTFSDTDSVKPMFYVERYRDTSILALPRGIDLEVLWEAAGEGTVEVRQAVCSVHASARYPGAASAPVKVSPGMTGVAYTVTDGEAVLPDGFEERVWTAPELASFLGIASAGVSWRLGLTGTTLLIGLAAALVILLVLLLSQRAHRPGLPLWICFFVFCAAALEAEAAFWFFADAVGQRAMWKGVAALSLLAMYLLRRRKEKPAESLLAGVLPGLAAALAADILMCWSAVAGGAVYALSHVLLAVCFLRRAPMRAGRWVQWGLTSLATAALIAVGFVRSAGLMGWAVAAYAPFLLLMFYAAGRQSDRIRYAARFWLASDVLLGAFFTVAPQPLFHAAAMFLFSLSLLLIALSGRGRRSPAGAEDEGVSGTAPGGGACLIF